MLLKWRYEVILSHHRENLSLPCLEIHCLKILKKITIIKILIYILLFNRIMGILWKIVKIEVIFGWNLTFFHGFRIA